MILVRPLAVLSGALAFLLLAACGGVTGPSSNTQTSFSGTLQVGGFASHVLNVSRNGEFEVRDTALAPESTAFVGLEWGPAVGGQCSLTVFQRNPFATLDRTALGGIVNRGEYCVTIYDSGTLTQANTYTVRVSHP